MSTNTGGPAFPQPNHTIVTDRGREEARGWMSDSGMTLLDWYAGQLLTGYVAHNGVSGNFDQHAKECYDIAAAMLAEKARRESVVQQSSTTQDAGKVVELQEANRELVEALEACNAAFRKLDPAGGSDCGFAWASVQAVLAKHKGAA